jgi:4-amino-4-deoxy-L-arabinose transferase-like glycosyltransferase
MSTTHSFWRSPWPVRIALGSALALLIVYSLFGIAAPLWWGHHGYNAAVYLMRARTSLRNHTIVPCTWTGFDPPRPDSLYLHHPIGYHQIFSLLIPIFGDHEWLARGVGLAGTLVVCSLLYATVRRFWSREAGAVCVWIYVLLPIVTSYSNFCDAMMPTFACIVWGVSAYLRLLENHDPTKTRRLLLEAFFAYAICGVLMWEMYFIAPFISLHALAVRRRYRDLPRFHGLDPLIAHILTIGTACVLMMSFHLWFTHHSGAWGDFIDSYRVRKAPPSGSYVIDRHLQWLDVLYGPPPILLSLAWLVTFFVRVILGRVRRRDLLPLTFLYVNSLYIWLFAEGSAVHLYRVFMFSGFFAFAMTDLLVEIVHGASRLVSRPAAVATAAAVLAAYFALEVPHAWANLFESRVMMGTHAQPGYNPEREKMRFAQEVHRLVPQNGRLIIHYPELTARKELWYYLDRSFDEINHLSELPRVKRRNESVLLLDEPLLTAGERTIFRDLIRQHPVTYFDHFVMVDLRSSQPGETSWAFVDQPMSPAYKFWVSHKYAPLGLTRRAYLPGVCEALFVGAPIAKDEALPPAPRALALQPCWHNLLVARGLGATDAERSVVGALPPLGKSLGAIDVVAAGREGGNVRIVYRANQPLEGELRYAITTPSALKLPPGSKVAPPQPTPRMLPRGATVPSPKDWRAGYLYQDVVAVPPNATSFAVELVTSGGKPTALSHLELPH